MFTLSVLRSLGVVVLLGLTMACSADETAPVSPASQQEVKAEPGQAVSPEQRERILSKLRPARPDLTFTEVRTTRDPALFEVEFNGGNVVYATASGNFFLVGDLFGFDQGRIVNITDERKSAGRAALIAGVNPKNIVSFGPEKGDAKAEVFVFTDVDCHYCRKLHSEIEELNALGVRVNYLAFPRSGIDSPVAKRMQSAWCSDNPQQAITKLKQGKTIPSASCDSNAVAEQYILGTEIGVSGTPALVTSDGVLIPGYRPAKELAKALIGS